MSSVGHHEETLATRTSERQGQDWAYISHIRSTADSDSDLAEALAGPQHVLRGVRGAVLALVVRQ